MTRKDYELISEAIREARSKVLKSSNTDLMSEYRTGCNDALYELYRSSYRADSLMITLALMIIAG
jgi:hypothetical protein